MEHKIGVVGLWHLGCTLSACWAKLGHSVIGYDANQSVVENLNRGEPPIFEPGLNDILKKNIQNKTLKFTTKIDELSSCDFVFLAYDTPVLDNDESDLRPLEKAINAFVDILANQTVVIVSSQTPVGTCQKFRKKLLAKNKTLDLVYSPENIRLGEAMETYLNPSRIIVGVENYDTQKRITDLFKDIPAELLIMNLSSAEMVKHGINSFLALSITFANQLADLCEQTNADILDVLRGIKSDPRIGIKSYLSPGIGFSGGTLGRDLKVLKNLNNDLKTHSDLFEKIYESNSQRSTIILNRLKTISGGSLSKRRIGVLGLTYKPRTSTLRRSLPVEIVKQIIKEGAEISVFDPKADYSEWPERNRNFSKAESAENVISNSDVVVLFTEWPQFRAITWTELINKKKPQAVFDTKNFLADLHLNEMGYRYFGVGRDLAHAEN